MLYKPNFCADCGEKVARERWQFWMSRRFCEDCAMKIDGVQRFVLLTVAVVGVFVGGILFGQLRRERKPPVLTSARPAAMVETSTAPVRSANTASISVAAQPGAVRNQTQPPQTVVSTPSAAAPNSPAVQTKAVVPVAPTFAPETIEATYFCGARTQKGTPCSRRVKSADRCWQHPGKPAMLPIEKLRIQ